MLRGRFWIAIATAMTVMLAGSAAAFAGNLFSKNATDQGYGPVVTTTTTTTDTTTTTGTTTNAVTTPGDTTTTTDTTAAVGQGSGPTSGVAGQSHSLGNNGSPLAAAASPQSGTLPFTGAQLGVFLALGLALLVGGLLLHRAGGRGRSRA